jgi:beta-glucanase (GH16 family)
MDTQATRTLLRCLPLGLLAAVATPAHAQNWTLVWSDEFNGTSVNLSNWNFEVGGGGWGNHELEYYTNGANASIQNGALVIEARRQSMGGMSYTSSRMTTKGKHEFTYGRIEARIAMPAGAGLWPAFWMLGANIGTVGWPACGETDIMEHVNNDAAIHGTIHWDAGGHASYGGSLNVPNVGAYHVYTVEWTPASIKWFVDGTQYVEANILNNINSTEEFHRPFFILLNLAVGGDWPGSPNASTPFPARMYVDYVRVYQQATTPPSSGIDPGAWYNVVNQTSSLCVDDGNWGTTNGSIVLQWTCGSAQYNQEWQLRPTDSGYYNVFVRQAPTLGWDVTGGPGATGNGVKVQLWAIGGSGGTNQQWMPVALGSGYYKFVARHSGRCLDVPGSSRATGVQLQQWDCNGTGAQAFKLLQQP